MEFYDIMKNSILILLAILLTGCATLEDKGFKPFATIGVGYQLDSRTDYWVQTERKDQCSVNAPFFGDAGLHHRKNWKIYYSHQSWVACGGPFNSKPEIYADYIKVDKQFGGWNHKNR